MADAGKKKSAHASEHLPDGTYNQPEPEAIQAAMTLATGTNNTAESGIGLLDRLQTYKSIRNIVNTPHCNIGLFNNECNGWCWPENDKVESGFGLLDRSIELRCVL